MQEKIDIADKVLAVLAAAVLWFGGESGRVIVAGGLGGLARFLQGERKRIRDGLLAVSGGALAANYLWPLPFHLMGAIAGPLDRTPENVVMAGFLAGALGMSFVKVLTAFIEARVAGKKGADDA